MRSRPWAALAIFVAAGFTLPAGASDRLYGSPQDPHVIKVSETGLDPAALTVQKGDVVRWEWVTGAHAFVSEETPEQEEGAIFSFPLNTEKREFTRTFSEVGTVPYFDLANPQTLRGTISVVAATPVNIATWGRLKALFERP